MRHKLYSKITCPNPTGATKNIEEGLHLRRKVLNVKHDIP